MDDFENYAGQSVHIERLRSEFTEGTFTHAYLFAGPVGTGKKSVARLCAMTALCRGEHRPCGVCGPCRRVLAETHPDVHVLRPAAGKREIAVGQMRELLKEADVHTFEDGVKVFLIPEAEKMNAASQNTLLKTLEEPASNTVFLLTTVHLSALLPTVVSRCRLIRFHPLTDEETAARLRALGVPEEQVGVRARIAEGCVGQALAVEEKVVGRILSFFFLYVVTFGLFVLLLSISGITLMQSAGYAAACLTSDSGAALLYGGPGVAALPGWSQLLMALLMIVGRIEVFSFILLAGFAAESFKERW